MLNFTSARIILLLSGRIGHESSNVICLFHRSVRGLNASFNMTRLLFKADLVDLTMKRAFRRASFSYCSAKFLSDCALFTHQFGCLSTRPQLRSGFLWSSLTSSIFSSVETKYFALVIKLIRFESNLLTSMSTSCVKSTCRVD